MAAGGKTARDFTGQVMTVDEVAELLRIHRSTLYRLIRHQEIPFFRMGSDYRFSRAAINKWSRAQEANSTAILPAITAPKPDNG